MWLLHLAIVLSPLIGKTEYYVKNLNEFAKEVREIKLDPRGAEILQCVCTVHECADRQALEVIKLKLEEDDTLSERTPLNPDDLIRLLGVCLNYTNFLFKGEY